MNTAFLKLAVFCIGLLSWWFYPISVYDFKRFHWNFLLLFRIDFNDGIPSESSAIYIYPMVNKINAFYGQANLLTIEYDHLMYYL